MSCWKLRVKCQGLPFFIVIVFIVISNTVAVAVAIAVTVLAWWNGVNVQLLEMVFVRFLAIYAFWKL
jgi:hypothetical protein